MRGFDVSGIQVFADGSRTPLPLTTDTYVLGGKTVRVRGECWPPVSCFIVQVCVRGEVLGPGRRCAGEGRWWKEAVGGGLSVGWCVGVGVIFL